MMELHPTAGSDCTCSGHRQCCQFHWSPCSCVIATAIASAGVSHSRDVYAPHTGVTHLRDTVPLALEFHTHAMPCLRADDGYGLLLSNVQHLLWGQQTLPTSSFWVMWCISYETVVHCCRWSPRPAFKQCVASTMRPLCMTTNGSHVPLSSKVVYQLWDHRVLLQMVVTFCFRVMCYPHPACQATHHPHLAFLATLGISYRTVMLYRRRCV